MREPTSCHRFTLQKKNSRQLVKRKFGKKLNEETVYLCNLCSKYCSSGNPHWRHAWPSVFFSLLSDDKVPTDSILKICSLQPVEIRVQWRNAAGFFPKHVQLVLTTPVLNGEGTVDGTNRLQRFQKLIDTGKSEDLAVALDEEPYPNVRCPFGCWCFLEEGGGIGLQHFINKYKSNFTAFGANFSRIIRGIRSDCFVPRLTLQTFLVSATVQVSDTEGIIVQTCSMHSRGSELQYIHVPCHPTLKRNPTLFAERLTQVSPTISTVTNTKANFASHTYQLLGSIGSYSVE